jgi:6,7-dimethyl-8-ribityllumazine synthase
MKCSRTSDRIRPLRIPDKASATEGVTSMKIHQGKLQAKGFRIAIVVSRFNSFISERLLEGALEALQKMGAQEADLEVYKVPGSFEVPLVAKKIAKAKTADGILCIGALIRGDTPHFDFLSAEVTKGLAQIAMDDGVPVSFGILTVDTVEQGIERAGTKAGNKGYDAAFSLVETLNVIKEAGLR